jgi:protein-L-isoaspartate(D-aspartate) O-methyltransferase
MVQHQLIARGITDPAVLDAMAQVPRELFVRPELAPHAYDDMALPNAAGQTVSQPYIVALMAQAAALGPGDRVLDVGCGSGYGAAVLAQLGSRVFGVERLPMLAEQAGRRLREAGYAVEVACRDGRLGWPERAPFDAIICAAATPDLPQPWRDQLAVGGRLVFPREDDRGHQDLLCVTPATDADDVADLGPVIFVPLHHGVSPTS